MKLVLDPRAQRIVDAGRALYGDRWKLRLAVTAGISQTLMNHIAFGERSVTDAVEEKVASAPGAEIKRMHKSASQLERILKSMRGE